MSAVPRAVDCLITWRHDWAPHLFSFRTERPEGIVFVPGQFVRLGVVGADGAPVFRAYSIASRPADTEFEFYSIVVPDGPFTQPLARLGVGDGVAIDRAVYGSLRADRFEGGRHLWLLATGTGVAPFRSMLLDAAVWGRFERIVLVHSVRHAEELAYRDAFEALATTPPGRGCRFDYLPTLTGRDAADAKADAPADAGVDTLMRQRGRITTLLASGDLESRLDLPLASIDSRLMICGNPTMIREVRSLLGARGMTPVRRETPGQFIAENFW